MLVFSALIMAGCVVYSFFDEVPFLENPYFGDILGAAAAIAMSALVLAILDNDGWFFRGCTNFAEVMDGLTFLWIPAAFGLWVFIVWRWNHAHGIHAQSILKKIILFILCLF